MEEKDTLPGLNSETLNLRYSMIMHGIEDAARKVSRDPSRIEVMAVSKFHPFSVIKTAYEAGLRRFGESRVQEALEKYKNFRDECPDGSYEMIGHLQSNKAKKAIGIFDCIHSVDSSDLLLELGKHAIAAGKTITILLEYHTAEDSKSGFPDKDSLFKACDIMTRPEMMGTLIPSGLMTMAPLTPDESRIRSAFSLCRETFSEIARMFGFASFLTLSMGMSSDYLIAVEEGATLVRIGSALFGARTS